MRRMLIHAWGVFCLALMVGLSVGGCAPSPGAASHAAPTPTFAPTVAGALSARATRALASIGRRVDVEYDAHKQAATATIIVTGYLPNTNARMAAAYALVKRITYQVMPALWSSGVALREVTVIVLGPIQDEYADIINDWYGVAVVEATTAQRIQWASVSPDAAWAMYDQHNLRISFELFD